jgi:hypothetical protein
MKQDTPFVALGRYDIGPLKARLAAEPESSWTSAVAVQRGNWPHRDARHIALANDLDGRHHQATIFPRYAEYKDLITPLLRTIASRLNRGKNVMRLQFAWLGAGSVIAPHRDTSVTLVYSHRVHIPIATNDQVIFECGDESVNMPEGEIWTFDNTLRHAVYNKGDTPRIHLIADFAEPLPLRAWLPYMKHRLYRLRKGDTRAHRRLVREAGARVGTIEF